MTRCSASGTGPYHERLVRDKFRNLAMNRPDTTNLNHQYANRRFFMGLSSCRKNSPTAALL